VGESHAGVTTATIWEHSGGTPAAFPVAERRKILKKIRRIIGITFFRQSGGTGTRSTS
jgi:hypothetical protein